MTSTSSILRQGALAAAVLIGAAASASVATAQTRNCIDTLAGMPEFSRFVNGVVRTSAVGAFRSAGEITIFAPTNDALARMDRNLLDRLFPMSDGARQPDPVLAPAAVGAHVIQGRRDAAALGSGGEYTTVAGTPIRISASGGTVTVAEGDNVARVTRPDIACSNGVIHGIDSSLVR